MKIMAIYDKMTDQGNLVKSMLVWPDSALIRSGKPVFIPDYKSGWEVLIGMGVKIDRLGKSITKSFSSRYYNEVTPIAFLLSKRNTDAITLNIRGIVNEYVADYTVICGNFINKETLPSPSIWKMEITTKKVLDRKVLEWVCSDFEREMSSAIEYASRCNTLKTGDLIAVFIPKLSAPAERDTRLEVRLEDQNLLQFKMK